VVNHLLGELRIDCLGFHRDLTRLMKCAELFRTLRLALENDVFEKWIGSGGDLDLRFLHFIWYSGLTT
jgi:hypothetical protein